MSQNDIDKTIKKDCDEEFRSFLRVFMHDFSREGD